MAQEERPRHARICRDTFFMLLKLYLALRFLAKTTGLKVTTFIQIAVKHISTYTGNSDHILGLDIKSILPHTSHISLAMNLWSGAASLQACLPLM